MIDLASLWELFRHSIAALLVVGAGMPILGVFLFVRRAGFHGIVLPQCATTGLAVGYWVLPAWAGWAWRDGPSLRELLADPHHLEGYLQAWALAGALVGAALTHVARRTRGAEAAWLAALFAASIGATMALRSRLPHAGEAIDAVLGGEVILIDAHGLAIVSIAVVVAAAAVLAARRLLVVAVVSPELARLEGRRASLAELSVTLATTLVIGVGVSIVGPYAAFSSLVIAPLAARRFVRSFRAFLWLSSALGALAAIVGVVLAFGPLDLPLGPAVVLGATLSLAPYLVPRRG
ncbi:MAG: metal ABC transporter permease [Planctomycetota bacterium]